MPRSIDVHRILFFERQMFIHIAPSPKRSICRCEIILSVISVWEWDCAKYLDIIGMETKDCIGSQWNMNSQATHRRPLVGSHGQKQPGSLFHLSFVSLALISQDMGAILQNAILAQCAEDAGHTVLRFEDVVPLTDREERQIGTSRFIHEVHLWSPDAASVELHRNRGYVQIFPVQRQ